MSNRRHPGIYEHEGLVYPVDIVVSNPKIHAKFEEGFTFSLPDDVKEQLSMAFINACRDSVSEESYQRMVTNNNKRYRKVLGNRP